MKQSTGLRRQTIDKYYTSPEVVNLCLDLIKKHVQIFRSDLVIEPSAGNGAFIKGIRELSDNVLFFDIAPEHPDVQQQDFLEFKCDYEGDIHVIGNPPFGRQSSTAIKFVRKSCEFCKTFAFILPRSFKKQSLKNKVPGNFRLIAEVDVPPNAFLVNGVAFDVPCVFQIYMKHLIFLTPHETVRFRFFDFVKKSENPDLAFRRVGVKAGSFDTNIQDKNENTHYFIKLVNQEDILLFEKLNFEFNNTVGARSISSQELIGKFQELKASLND